jgi:hypothetical protein
VLALCLVASVAIWYRSHRISQGQEAFERLGCPSCHIAGGAPSLAHVGVKYNRPTFVDWVSDPEIIYARLGRKPLNPGYQPMPRMEASHRDIEAISYFLSALR